MTTPPAGARSPFARVAVVGCGLVGGSLALAAARTPGVAEVVVTDVDPDTLTRAAARGIGHRREPDPAAAVRGADLVVLATPVAVTSSVFQKLESELPPGVVVTDVGSVKANLLREVEALSRPRAGAEGEREGGQEAIVVPSWRFIGGHPMAGSERSGVDAADGTLFQGATWVLTPTPRSDPAAFEALSAFLRALGARVLAVEPELHDQLVAVASHLPQVLASTLMDEAAEAARRSGEAVLAVAAGGFRDATRVAGSDPELWVGILRENRDAVLTAIDGFLARLRALRTAVDTGTWDEVHALLDRARTAQRQLPTKYRVGRLVDLVIPVEDHPGVLSEVTTALGEAGVNIEDLAMRHATELERGALLVAVDGEDAAHRAQRVLARRGFASHVEPR